VSSPGKEQKWHHLRPAGQQSAARPCPLQVIRDRVGQGRRWYLSASLRKRPKYCSAKNERNCQKRSDHTRFGRHFMSGYQASDFIHSRRIGPPPCARSKRRGGLRFYLAPPERSGGGLGEGAPPRFWAYQNCPLTRLASRVARCSPPFPRKRGEGRRKSSSPRRAKALIGF
jgi:hypothetical protein